MKLYEVYNEYHGNTAVHCLVVAESEERALGLARLKFQDAARSIDGTRYIYPEQYWTELTADVLCDDVAVEWAGDASGD